MSTAHLLARHVALAAAMAGGAGALQAQADRPAVLAAATADGISLRWAWPAGERPVGYFVERRTGDQPWTRLTSAPITRLRNREAVRALLRGAYDRYEALLFPTDPMAELRDPESIRSLLLFAADVEPSVARVLGLRYDDRDVRPGVAYRYRLIALVAGSERLQATTGAVTAGPEQLPEAPDSLVATQTPAGVALHWNPRAAFTAYNVWRGAADGVTQLNAGPVVLFAEPGGVGAGSAPAMFVDRAPPAGGAVSYRVEGIDAFGRLSARSAPVSVALRDVIAPAPPLGLVTAVAGDTVVLRWTPPPDADVTAYQLWRAQRSDSGFTKVGAPVPSGAGTVARDAGRPAARLFWYRVTAVDRAGNESVPSAPAVAEVPDLSPPATPDSLTGSIIPGRAALRWRAVKAPDVRGYRVYRASTPGGEFGLLTSEPLAAAAYTDTIRIRARHPFYYRVTALDSAMNESPPTAPLALRPPDVTAPTAPVLVAVRPGDGGLIATWLANPEPDVAGYLVRRRPAGDTAWLPGGDSVSVTRTVDTLRGVPPRAEMDVAVQAVDSAGNRSEMSRPMAGRAAGRREAASLEVDRLTWDAVRARVMIEWRPPAGQIAQVVVLRRGGADSVFRTIGGAAPASGRFADATARPGVRYEYALRVLDRGGASADSRRPRAIDLKPGGAR